MWKVLKYINFYILILGPKAALPGRVAKPRRKAAAPRQALQGLVTGSIPPPAVPGPAVVSTPPLPLQGQALDVPLPVRIEHQQAEVNPRGEPYDPEDPTTDEIEEIDRVQGSLQQNFDLVGFQELISSQINALGQSLEKKVTSAHNTFVDKFSETLTHLNEKVAISSNNPNFKSEANRKHFDRCKVYLSFLSDAKFFLKSGQTEDCLACLETAIEAITKYKKDILIADVSPAGWELVERMD